MEDPARGSTWQAMVALLGAELRIAVRAGGDAAIALAFFAVTVTLFPLGVGPAPEVLTRIAPGVIWVTALLATLLPLDRLFAADHADGTLEQLALTGRPLELVVLIKALVHWLVTALPLILIAPLLALMLGLTGAGLGVLVLSLLLGTPALCLIGTIAAALSVGARRAGMLISLLALPLQIPPLIFAVSAVDATMMDLTPQPHLLLLAATSLFALTVAPFAAALALRQALESG